MNTQRRKYQDRRPCSPLADYQINDDCYKDLA
nr:MAG TPA_asm: hypothetical protein [Caudoviricetes sp.]